MTDTDTLIRAKKKIDELRDRRANIAGQLQEKYVQLKKEFQAPDMKKAKSILSEKDQWLDSAEDSFKKQLDKLKDFPWDE